MRKGFATINFMKVITHTKTKRELENTRVIREGIANLKAIVVRIKKRREEIKKELENEKRLQKA